MGVRLTVKMRGEAGGADKSRVVMLDAETITLGRDPKCQVVLAQQAVSRTHASITKEGPHFFIQDLGSAFGTTINGQKLPKGEKRSLRNGDIIIIAQFDVVFDRVAEAPQQSNNTRFVSRNVISEAMSSLNARPFFRIMNGSSEGQHIEIGDAQEYVFGRDETADIMLRDDLVSRRHAKIRRDWSGIHLEDLESRNGIKVNRKKVQRADLKDHDVVQIGNVKLQFFDPTTGTDAPVVLPGLKIDDEEGTQALSDEEQKAAEEAAKEAERLEQERLEAEQKAQQASEEQTEAQAPEDVSGQTEVDPNAEAHVEGEGEQQLEGEQEQQYEGEVDDGALEDSEIAEGEEGLEDEGPRKLIDFSDKRTMIVLGIVGLMVIIAIVLIVAIVVGF